VTIHDRVKNLVRVAARLVEVLDTEVVNGGLIPGQRGGVKAGQWG